MKKFSAPGNFYTSNLEACLLFAQRVLHMQNPVVGPKSYDLQENMDFSTELNYCQEVLAMSFIYFKCCICQIWQWKDVKKLLLNTTFLTFACSVDHTESLITQNWKFMYLTCIQNSVVA